MIKSVHEIALAVLPKCLELTASTCSDEPGSVVQEAKPDEAVKLAYRVADRMSHEQQKYPLTVHPGVVRVQDIATACVDRLFANDVDGNTKCNHLARMDKSNCNLGGWGHGQATDQLVSVLTEQLAKDRTIIVGGRS